jgi:hypothetical protein
VARKRTSSVARALDKAGQRGVELTLEQTESLRDAWRRIYARPLKRSLGVWHRGRYDWHVFSYGDTHALDRADALNAYHAEKCTELFVLPNDKHELACRITTKRPPALEGAADVYVFPPDLSWTMVFTHEDGWLGPYFSRAAWVDAPPALPGRRGKR